MRDFRVKADDGMSRISKNLRRLRANVDMSQTDLAKKLNVSQQSVSAWELGQRTPGIDDAVKLSQFFGVPADNFLDGSVMPSDLIRKAEEDKHVKRFRRITSGLNDNQIDCLLDLVETAARFPR